MEIEGRGMAWASVLLVIGAAGITAWAWPDAIETSAATVHVTIVADRNVTLFNGSVQVDNATALSALQAAALQAELELDVVAYPGFGRCGDYVAELAGLREHRDGTGWQYHVLVESQWEWGAQGAACRPLADGDALRWSWIP